MRSGHLRLGLSAGVKLVDKMIPASWVRRWRVFEQEDFINKLRDVNQKHVVLAFNLMNV